MLRIRYSYSPVHHRSDRSVLGCGVLSSSTKKKECFYYTLIGLQYLLRVFINVLVVPHYAFTQNIMFYLKHTRHKNVCGYVNFVMFLGGRSEEIKKCC